MTSEKSSRRKLKTYKLFLDDVRDSRDAYRILHHSIFLESDWIQVKNYQEFVDVITDKYLNAHSFPGVVSFDHDLATEHYIDLVPTQLVYDSFMEKTGYSCAKWLIDFCIDKDLPLPEYFCHSLNPGGKENILSILKNYKCEYCSSEGYHSPNCMKNV